MALQSNIKVKLTSKYGSLTTEYWLVKPRQYLIPAVHKLKVLNIFKFKFLSYWSFPKHLLHSVGSSRININMFDKLNNKTFKLLGEPGLDCDIFQTRNTEYFPWEVISCWRFPSVKQSYNISSVFVDISTLTF